MSTINPPEPVQRDERGARLPGVALLLRRSWWVALGLVLGLLAGVVTTQLRPAVYESTAILTVSTATPGTDPISTARAAQALARLATQPGVVGAPLRDAGLVDAAASPRTFVRVQAAPDAPIIEVTGSATDPETAQEVADTVSRTLAGVDEFPPFTATVVAAALRPSTATAPGWALPAGGAGVGVVLAVVLAATVPPRRRAPRPAVGEALPA
jgi:hypothetical protein